MTDAFISYSHSDAAFAEALGVALEAQRLSVWRDQRMLLPSDNFSEKIRGAIRNSSSVIVIWSESSRASEWVHREASIADYARKLVQVCIDSAPPPSMYGAQLAANFPESKVPIDRDSKAFLSLVKVVKRRKAGAIMSKFFVAAVGSVAIALMAAMYVLLEARVSGAEGSLVRLSSDVYVQPTKACLYEKVGRQTFYWPVPAGSPKEICESIARGISENAEYFPGEVKVHYRCIVGGELKEDVRCGDGWSGSKQLQAAK